MLVYNDKSRLWEYWWEGGFHSTPIVGEQHHENCILYIHGYCNSKQEVKEDMLKIKSATENKINADLRGFYWNSRDKAFGYFTDLRTCKKTAPRLKKKIDELHEFGYRIVSVMAHSMGGFLVMKALQKEIQRICSIYRIALLGADAYRRRFKRDNTFGICSYKINALQSYYSKYDRVLGFPANLARPGQRIGKHDMPRRHPSNYIDQDANYYSDDKIRHNDYINQSQLIIDACNWLVKI